MTLIVYISPDRWGFKITSFKQHLENIKSQSAIMEKVYEDETEKCIRVGKKLLAKLNITSKQNELPRSLSQKKLAESNKEGIRKRNCIVIITKNSKMTMKLILKQAYLGCAIKTLYQSLKVTCFLCKNERLVPNIS